MSIVTVRIPDELEASLKIFCKEEDRSKSWIIKKALQEKLEDWQDLRSGLKALKEHRKNGEKTATIEELAAELGVELTRKRRKK